eukprot:GHVT01048403.1.p2 GENE.GHVT01048403.1~~GHVT01048403.1.p2  ORF type:complete len:191 (+),score=48.31 GHVT01048403.1:216-788(+)
MMIESLAGGSFSGPSSSSASPSSSSSSSCSSPSSSCSSLISFCGCCRVGVMSLLGGRVGLRSPLLLASLPLILLWFLSATFAPVSAIDVHVWLQPNQQRCVREQLPKHVLVIAEFEAIEPATNLAVVVTEDTAGGRNSPPGRVVFHDKDKPQVKTAFTSIRAVRHRFCVQNIGKARAKVRLCYPTPHQLS